jgi:hypothetical protein
MPKGTPPLWQASAAFRKVSSSSCRPWARAGRIHRLHVDAGVLLHQVDARAGPLDLAADAGGNGEPLAAALPRYLTVPLTSPFCLMSGSMTSFTARADRLRVRPPGRHREDVVAGLRLRLGGDGQQVLVALEVM